MSMSDLTKMMRYQGGSSGIGHQVQYPITMKLLKNLQEIVNIMIRTFLYKHGALDSPYSAAPLWQGQYSSKSSQ